MQPNPTPLAKRIKRLRKLRKMSRTTLAAKMGVKPPSVHDWENGYTSPRLDRLSRLAALLEVTVDELISGRES